MQKDFLLESHYIVKALNELVFPVKKEELISRYGQKKIRVNTNNEVLFKEIIDTVKLDNFNSAAELYSAIYSRK